MNITESKEKGSIILNVELERADIEPFLRASAKHLAESISIPGFRPGMAPYDLVARQIGGEARIYEEALERIVGKTLTDIIIERKIETIGQPAIQVKKMVPGFGVAYEARLTLMPTVTLADIQTITLEPRSIEVSEKEVATLVDKLREMRASEAQVDRPAQKGDRVVLDFEVTQNNVVIDQGTAKNYPLIIGEERFIPGFEDHVIGMKAGETKDFELKFPSRYHAAELAGKPAQFSVKISQVFNRQIPELTDEFAKSLGGYENADALRKQVENNIRQEREAEERERFEMSAMEQLAEKSQVSPLPEQLVQAEVEKMLHELEHGVEEQGMEMDKYLESIKKTREDLAKDFKPKAEHRLKISLVARSFGQKERVDVSDEEVDREIEVSKRAYGSSPEMRAQLDSADYKNYVRNILASRKVFQALAEQVRKNSTKK